MVLFVSSTYFICKLVTGLKDCSKGAKRREKIVENLAVV